jgi:putative peptidoglycan lipid II flippase
VWRASVALSALSLGTQLAQLGLQVVLARLYGAGAEVDAYVAAHLAVALLVGPSSQLAVPLLVRSHEKGSAEYARARDALLLWVGLIAAAIAAILLVWPGSWLALVAPGLSSEAQSLAPGYLAWAAPALVPMAWMSLLAQAHNARSRFAVPALVGGLAAGGLLVGFFLFHESLGLSALLIGQLATQSVAAAVLLVSEWRATGAHPALRHPELRRLAWLALPVVVAAVNVRVNITVDRHFASLLEAGSLSILFYADRWITLTQAVLAMPLVTVLYTHLARSEAGDRARAPQPALAAGLFTGLPVAVGTFVLAPDLAHALLAGAGGQASAAPLLGACLRAYVGVLALGAYGSLLVRVYYVRSDTRTPLWLGGVLPMALNLAGDAWAAPRFGLVGIAWVSSATAALVLVLMTAVLVAREPGAWGATLRASVVRTAAGCTALALAGWAAAALAPAGLARLAVFAVLGPLCFFTVAAAAGSVEARELFGLLRGRTVAEEGA